MIKQAINNFMIWLNTPREIDIPVFGESKDAALYDELYKQKETLERRKEQCLQDAYNFFCARCLKEDGVLPPKEAAEIEAQKMFDDARAKGLINEFNKYVINEV